MSETVKLIIEIPESDYKAICANKEDSIIAHDTCRRIANNGTLLDNVKAEIAEEICLTDNPYTKETKYTIEYFKLLEILGYKKKGGGK